jgi:hypothetical protein
VLRGLNQSLLEDRSFARPNLLAQSGTQIRFYVVNLPFNGREELRGYLYQSLNVVLNCRELLMETSVWTGE